MSDIWYRSLNGQTEGPITLRDLQHMADIGTLKPTDLISQDGTSWKPASDSPEVRFYAANIHSLNYPAPNQQPAQVTQRVIDLLRQTGLWVRIMSIIFLVSCAFMLLGGVIMIVAGIFAASHDEAPIQIIMGIVYIPLAFLYIIPGLYLFRYASHAKAFAKLRSEQELEEAIQAQKSFWKFVTITALVIIGLYLLAIPVVIVAAILAHR